MILPGLARRAMLRPMFAIARQLQRAAFAGLALAMLAGTAVARDYVVVASTDPSVPRGLTVDAGARLAVSPGHTVTLMHASGDVLKLKGAAGGVVAPARKAASAEAARLEVLRVMISPTTREVSVGSGQRRSRSGVCPSPDTLTTLDAVAEVETAGCHDVAITAFETWLASHPPTEL